MSLAIFLKNNIVIQTVHTVGLTQCNVSNICDEFAVWRKFWDCTVKHNTHGGSPFTLSFVGFCR